MSDRFHPISISQLWMLINNEYQREGKILGIDRSMFYKPENNDRFRTALFGHHLASPLGVAAGPHSQMAQNIIASWLMGSRYIELKTIQTLDELDVSKPCIDMQDEGYNCEWSQELKIKESFDEYLNAWIIIHLLHHKLGFKGEVDTIFNMSVGYNMEGILKDNVQWFLTKMRDAKTELEARIAEIEPLFPEIKNTNIPSCISDNITLSTMHGCPANEIEEIAHYLLEEHKLHTFVKLNPTLLGPDHLREILNKKLKFKTIVPDEAFAHDLKYPDAINIITALQKVADEQGLTFGLKLTNTLESLNEKNVFGAENDMMYMSGRALHPISINVAAKLQKEFGGKLKLSFSGGIDAFNVADTLACGFKTITVCSDLLKPGGYTRMKQYFTNLTEDFNKVNANNIPEFILNKSNGDNPVQAAYRQLQEYAEQTVYSSHYQRNYLRIPSIKTPKPLDVFDCISAPCEATCPAHQGIPSYMYFTAKGDFESAFKVITQTNAFPNATGMVCDHVCQTKCTRINYDETLAIRDIKRFVVEWHNEHIESNATTAVKSNGKKVAIAGAGPTGLSAAYFLRKNGFDVEVFEAKEKPGGMVSGAIPRFRISDDTVWKDAREIEKMGAKITYGHKVTKAEFIRFQKEYHATILAIGAQAVPELDIPGIDAQGVYESLEFLEKTRKGEFVNVGSYVAVIGGGNTAMDIARTAFRMTPDNGKVTIVYRRTIDEIPAVFQEIVDAMKEGVEFMELASPVEILTDDLGKVRGLKCIKMQLGKPDESGRRRPVPIDGSEFEMAADTVIPSIGQKVTVDFTDLKLLKTGQDGFETQIEHVYIGGDARLGASSLINGVADGRKIAEIITTKSGQKFTLGNDMPAEREKKPVRELMKKKALRVPGIHPAELSLDDRKNFNIVEQTFTEEEAKQEASRCLLCDEVCNICTTVCPNFANVYYKTAKETIELQKVIITNGKQQVVHDKTFEIKQDIQILNIDNFCNECGNCNTFCPTDGAPYKTKPKIFLTRDSFNVSTYGYYREKTAEGTKLIGKKEGEESSLLTKDDVYVYETKLGKVVLNRTDFSIIEVKLNKEVNEGALELHEAATMRVIMQGLSKYSFA
ncbi:MAG: putative selenate reductase subunit YgfK [Bacteroidetes bacterium]|nr:MAG: putative selenate reductase subunit YgfK [Bacteroidota bacterium]